MVVRGFGVTLFFLLLLLLLVRVRGVDEGTGGLWVTFLSTEDGCKMVGNRVETQLKFKARTGEFDAGDDAGDAGGGAGDDAGGAVAVDGGAVAVAVDHGGAIKFPNPIEVFLCTVKVDEMPLGSYCFYQNPQNCKSTILFLFYLKRQYLAFSFKMT